MKPETDSNVMSRCQCGCPKVSLSPCRRPRADCLSVCAWFRERVSVPLPCSFSAVCLRCRVWETTGLCWILSLHLRSTQSLDPVPLLCSLTTFEGFLLSLLILNFILALTLFLTAVRDLWQVECGCLLKAGCSLTLLSGPVSAPEGLLNCPRFSVRKRARKGQEARGAVVGLSNNACPNQISQEWISCV